MSDIGILFRGEIFGGFFSETLLILRIIDCVWSNIDSLTDSHQIFTESLF